MKGERKEGGGRERRNQHFPTHLHAYERRGKHLVFPLSLCVCVCLCNKHLIEGKENIVKL